MSTMALANRDVQRKILSFCEDERKFVKLLAENPKLTNQQIADRVGCGTSTVHRERQRMSRERQMDSDR